LYLIRDSCEISKLACSSDIRDVVSLAHVVQCALHGKSAGVGVFLTFIRILRCRSTPCPAVCIEHKLVDTIGI
jgi:hypothetical protein